MVGSDSVVVEKGSNDISKNLSRGTKTGAGRCQIRPVSSILLGNLCV